MLFLVYFWKILGEFFLTFSHFPDHNHQWSFSLKSRKILIYRLILRFRLLSVFLVFKYSFYFFLLKYWTLIITFFSASVVFHFDNIFSKIKLPKPLVLCFFLLKIKRCAIVGTVVNSLPVFYGIYKDFWKHILWVYE